MAKVQKLSIRDSIGLSCLQLLEWQFYAMLAGGVIGLAAELLGAPIVIDLPMIAKIAITLVFTVPASVVLLVERDHPQWWVPLPTGCAIWLLANQFLG